jgi:hypothetical protein
MIRLSRTTSPSNFQIRRRLLLNGTKRTPRKIENGHLSIFRLARLPLGNLFSNSNCRARSGLDLRKKMTKLLTSTEVQNFHKYSYIEEDVKLFVTHSLTSYSRREPELLGILEKCGDVPITRGAYLSAERRRAARFRTSSPAMFRWEGPKNRCFQGKGIARDISL